MALFAIAGRTEATPEAGCWSWTKKSGSGRVGPTSIRRSGEAALYAIAGSTEAIREAGHEKAQAASKLSPLALH